MAVRPSIRIDDREAAIVWPVVMRMPLVVFVLALSPLHAAMAHGLDALLNAQGGTAKECRGLCRAERRTCSPALGACLREGRAAGRAARAACGSAADPAGCRRQAGAARRAARAGCGATHDRCRTASLTDCRRSLDEPVVPENVLTACPVTPLTACAELGPDDTCTDALHPADAFFWDRFHAGDYAAIPAMLGQLEGALDNTPADPSLERHVAWTHIWRLGELPRGLAGPAELGESLAVTGPRFARARELNPGDPRVLGFLAAYTLVQGILFDDAALYDEGSALFREGIAAWPEFNYFSSGYILSQLPRESPGFQLGLEQQWRNVDVCTGVVVDRHDPDLDPVFGRETLVGRQRVCFNSWIAPFNLEGFFLNMGDMLVKDGQTATGVQIYEAARRVPGYDRWPYRDVLEQRIVQAAENAEAFNRPSSGRPIMVQSTYACAGCHQAR